MFPILKSSSASSDSVLTLSARFRRFVCVSASSSDSTSADADLVAALDARPRFLGAGATDADSPPASLSAGSLFRAVRAREVDALEETALPARDFAEALSFLAASLPSFSFLSFQKTLIRSWAFLQVERDAKMRDSISTALLR